MPQPTLVEVCSPIRWTWRPRRNPHQAVTSRASAGYALRLTDAVNPAPHSARVRMRLTLHTAARAILGATAGVEDVAGNTAMLANLLDGAKPRAGLTCPSLEGTKCTGASRRHAPSVREDDPRHMPPNFYDRRTPEARAEGKRWAWGRGRSRLR